MGKKGVLIVSDSLRRLVTNAAQELCKEIINRPTHSTHGGNNMQKRCSQSGRMVEHRRTRDASSLLARISGPQKPPLTSPAARTSFVGILYGTHVRS